MSDHTPDQWNALLNRVVEECLEEELAEDAVLFGVISPEEKDLYIAYVRDIVGRKRLE